MTKEATLEPELSHPMEELLRMDRIPHIWCPTCGLGTVVTAFASAIEKLALGLGPGLYTVLDRLVLCG